METIKFLICNICTYLSYLNIEKVFLVEHDPRIKKLNHPKFYTTYKVLSMHSLNVQCVSDYTAHVVHALLIYL